MDNTELEGRPRQPLMLKEWLELEYSAELSRDGFVGCYPRHLATAEPRTRSVAGCRRRRNGDVIARVSAAVRAALSRPPSVSARQREAVALPRSLSTRLRVVGFWKKRTGEMDKPVVSCSATAASSGRTDGVSSPAAMSPRARRMGRDSRQTGGDRAGLGGGRRSHETVAEGCECEGTCHLDEEGEREQEQRLSPVSVMDFLSQDGDDDCNDSGGCGDGHSESEDEGTSPRFEQTLANIRRASQHLLDRIRRFEQLAELDTSDVDDAGMTVDDDTSCHVVQLDSRDDEDTECGPGQWHLPGLPEASSPCASHCFKKLLEDFFREGLSSCHAGGSDNSDLEMSLLETAKAWLDGRHCCAMLRSDQKVEVEEIERRVRWRCFGEHERELLSSDMEGDIFCYLMEELVEELC